MAVTSYDVWVNFDGLRAKVARVKAARRALARRICEQWADDVVEWMKANALWSDDTGFARRTLQVIRKYAGDFTFRFTSEAPYIVFLEHDHAGEFAILGPALQVWAPILMERLAAAGLGVLR
jgi:hypothetical protein